MRYDILLSHVSIYKKVKLWFIKEKDEDKVANMKWLPLSWSWWRRTRMFHMSKLLSTYTRYMQWNQSINVSCKHSLELIMCELKELKNFLFCWKISGDFKRIRISQTIMFNTRISYQLLIKQDFRRILVLGQTQGRRLYMRLCHLVYKHRFNFIYPQSK